jgi:hypothetical protein
MATNAEMLGAAFESRDLGQVVALLDERVVWRGLPGWDYGGDADTSIEADDHREPRESSHHSEADPDHEHVPLCSSREEVRAVLEGFLAAGGTGHPSIVAEAGDSVVVDPRPDPALPFPLHQGFTFRGGSIVLIQDYPDRATALADLNPR